MLRHERHAIRTMALMLLAAGMMVFLSACSSDCVPSTAPLDSANPSSEDFRYPELTPELLADGPAPGFRFFSTDLAPRTTLDSEDPCDTAIVSHWFDQTHDRTLKIDHLVELKVRRGQMPFDTTLTIVAPQSCWAVADFYPHPFQFLGQVEIRWKVKDLNLPHDFDYDSLVPWYVNDAGEYVPVEYEWRGDHDELVVFTDHFSRYIISQRIQ